MKKPGAKKKKENKKKNKNEKKNKKKWVIGKKHGRICCC